MFIGITQMIYLLDCRSIFAVYEYENYHGYQVCNDSTQWENTEFKYTSAFIFLLVV
jgi:hypothetical protein